MCACTPLPYVFLLATFVPGWLSNTGRCLTFDGNADGWVHGDAAVNVVVKTLRGALSLKTSLLICEWRVHVKVHVFSYKQKTCNWALGNWIETFIIAAYVMLLCNREVCGVSTVLLHSSWISVVLLGWKTLEIVKLSVACSRRNHFFLRHGLRPCNHQQLQAQRQRGWTNRGNLHDSQATFVQTFEILNVPC